MGRSLHARFKRWDGIEPDTNGEMQKVGSGQQDAQVWKQSFLFLYHTIQPDYSHFNILPRTIFLRKQTPFPPYQNVSLTNTLHAQH
ncbi:hypothetical protein E4U31_006829 [Claviceps sp. LM219 group G6]|nr:hypothetical protein E4U15_000283 [Claviceps sp. LM218 group G6]KAG6109466.1 hypothetical protein E4U31_006829 [Claviceps sp. LM219 group G6]